MQEIRQNSEPKIPIIQYFNAMFRKVWISTGVYEMCLKLNVSVVVPEYGLVSGMLPLPVSEKWNKQLPFETSILFFGESSSVRNYISEDSILEKWLSLERKWRQRRNTQDNDKSKWGTYQSIGQKWSWHWHSQKFDQ